MSVMTGRVWFRRRFSLTALTAVGETPWETQILILPFTSGAPGMRARPRQRQRGVQPDSARLQSVQYHRYPKCTHPAARRAGLKWPRASRCSASQRAIRPDMADLARLRAFRVEKPASTEPDALWLSLRHAAEFSDGLR